MKCPYFSVYHKSGYCRCTQEMVGCQNNSDKCDTTLGRRCYEDDLWEDGFWAKIKVMRNMLLRNLW